MLLVRNVNPDGGLATDRAFVLANPAANALVSQYPRELDRNHLPTCLKDLGGFQPDSFLRQRTHLLANDAIAVIRPGDTTMLINVSFPDYLLSFSF